MHRSVGKGWHRKDFIHANWLKLTHAPTHAAKFSFVIFLLGGWRFASFCGVLLFTCCSCSHCNSTMVRLQEYTGSHTLAHSNKWQENWTSDCESIEIQGGKGTAILPDPFARIVQRRTWNPEVRICQGNRRSVLKGKHAQKPIESTENRRAPEWTHDEVWRMNYIELPQWNLFVLVLSRHVLCSTESAMLMSTISCLRWPQRILHLKRESHVPQPSQLENRAFQSPIQSMMETKWLCCKHYITLQ